MPIIANLRTCYCPQEREIVQRLQRLDVDGFLAHNVLLPDTNRSNLPNEHDIIILLPWAAYTIESKRTRFSYMYLRGNNYTEWANNPAQLGHSADRIIIKGRENPLAIAWRKGQILRSQYIIRHDPALRQYPVNSIVVVPQHITVVTDGCEQFEQLRVCKIGDMCESILADREKYAGVSFDPQDLRRIFEALDALPQTLDTGYSVGNFSLRRRVDVDEPGCPVRLDVFDGTETVSGERVEIRLYDTAQRDEATTRFLRRIRRRLIGLRRARDPHVVAIVGLLDLPECLLVAMERPRGSTLSDALRHRGKLPVAVSLSLVEQLASTVQRLHEKRIFHLDVRPDFVVLGNHLESHQGADHFLTGLTNPLMDEAIGSDVVYKNSFDESFAPPELRGPRHEDRGKPSVDVFSLGAVLAFCVMGEDYYRTRIVKGIVVPDTGSKVLDGVISTATAYRSAQRYQCATEFGAAVASLREHARV